MLPNQLKPGVYIIGAGPGDPDLLTIKAQKILARADVIVFADSLIPRAILQGARPDAEIIPSKSLTLEEILDLIVAKVRSQLSVARLHSGDPTLYSAIAEQIQGFIAANIPVEVIPGISAYQLAAAKLQTELTIPELVQTVILTRTSGRTQVPEKEELSSLAAHQASLCLYLSARHVEVSQAKLLQHYPPETPVAICYRLGWEDEKILVVPLKEMATATREANLLRTTLYVISPALAQNRAFMRSRLYHSSHSRLFRSASSPPSPSSTN